MRFIWPPRTGCTSSRQSLDPAWHRLRNRDAVRLSNLSVPRGLYAIVGHQNTSFRAGCGAGVTAARSQDAGQLPPHTHFAQSDLLNLIVLLNLIRYPLSKVIEVSPNRSLVD